MSQESPLVTLIVTPRERFSVCVDSLNSIVSHTVYPHRLIYIDGGTPTHLSSEIAQVCETAGYEHVRMNRFLSPNEARNIGVRMATTDYVVFVDNDVIVSEGWLGALIDCAAETRADVVAPLTCQKLPLHTEIHQAGGLFADDHRKFFSLPPSERRITDIHVAQGQKVAETPLERGEAQCCEFHCALVRRDSFERFGMLDEKLLATKEHIDFCMTVWSQGGLVMFEPKSVVTYLFPSRDRPLQAFDRRYFALRWSPTWQRRSLERFRKKWQLDHDPYFEKRDAILSWRHSEGLAKPIVKKIPFASKSYRLKMFLEKGLSWCFNVWSRSLASQYEKARNSAAANENA